MCRCRPTSSSCWWTCSRRGIAYLFISHDLAVVRSLAHRVGVMYWGAMCEVGKVEEVFCPPYHPYTYLLLSAVPEADPDQVMPQLGATSAWSRVRNETPVRLPPVVQSRWEMFARRSSRPGCRSARPIVSVVMLGGGAPRARPVDRSLPQAVAAWYSAVGSRQKGGSNSALVERPSESPLSANRLLGERLPAVAPCKGE